MLGMMQIMIWLLCIYLVFKGVDIFQIAWMSSRDARSGGIALRGSMIVIAVIEGQRDLPNFDFNR